MKRALLLVMAAVMVMTLTACGGGSKTYDVQSLCEVSLSGFDGYATANLINNQLVIKSICDDIQSKDGFETAATYALFFDTLRYKITSDKTEGLTNGDKLQIELTSYNKEAAKELKVSFSNAKFTYAVEGLVEGTVLDPFEGLEVAFTGISPKNGVVEINSLNCPDSVQNSGNFNAKQKSGVSNGDTIVIEYAYNEKQAEQNGVMFLEKEKEYTVEGLPEYPTSLQGIDISGVSKNINILLDKRIAEIKDSPQNLPNFPNITTTNGKGPTWDVQTSTTFEKGLYLVNKENRSDNAITAVYRIDIKGIVTESPVSRVPVGTEQEATEYLLFTVRGVYIQDNQLVIDENTSVEYKEKGTTLNSIITKAENYVKGSQSEEITLN